MCLGEAFAHQLKGSKSEEEYAAHDYYLRNWHSGVSPWDKDGVADEKRKNEPDHSAEKVGAAFCESHGNDPPVISAHRILNKTRLSTSSSPGWAMFEPI